MKTKNKIQKKAFAAIAATGLAIIGFASNAQPAIKSLFEDIETNHIAMVMGKTNSAFSTNKFRTTNLTGAGAYAAYLAPETEEPLELEDWMTNESGFSMMALIEAESESPLKLEDWMINENTIDANSFSFETETETSINVETWMLDENNFDAKINDKTADKPKVNNKIISTSKFVFSDVQTEVPLKIEDWMLSSKIW